MNGLLQRPQVADLVFQVYGKPLHPELFDILTIRTYEREDYRLSLWITRTGHVVTWQNDDVLLTEVADAEQAVPDTRRLYAKRMRGEHSAVVPCCHGIVYQASFQVETLPDELFHQVHREIVVDSGKRGVLQHLCPPNRWATAPLSHAVVDFRPGCLFLSTFHTFPEENTIIKSQTLIERG